MIKITIALLLAALSVSLLGNLILYRKALEFYAREAAIRMNPVTDCFSEENAALIAKPKTKPRIVVFGDSRAAMWAKHIPGGWGDLQLVNRGITGKTSQQLRQSLQQDVIAISPDLVILQIGVNDLKTIAVLPGTNNRAIETTYRNITNIAQDLSDRGINVIATTIFPPGPVQFTRHPIWSREVNEAIDIVNSRLLAFKYARVTVIDSDPILRNGKYIKPDYASDMLHLTEAGYQALNLALEPKVTTVLGMDRGHQ